MDGKKIRTDITSSSCLANLFNVFFFADMRYDYVMFDVDSKDSTVGMSCPPKPFVSPEFIKHLREHCLADQGTRSLFVLQISS